MKKSIFLSLTITLVFGLGVLPALSENIDPDEDGSQYAYSEVLGWLDFEPAGGYGMEVTDDLIAGYIRTSDGKWISLSCDNSDEYYSMDFCVMNDGHGNLSGYAWGEGIGWISFSNKDKNSAAPKEEYGVKINPDTGKFSGRAWGYDGWIDFDIKGGVKTFWRGDSYRAAQL